MGSDYYSDNDDIEQGSLNSDSEDYVGNYYEVKEKPTRTEFYRAPEQKGQRTMIIVLGVFLFIICLVDFFRLGYIHDHAEGENLDSYYNTLIAFIFALVLIEVAVIIWGNEITTIIGCITGIIAVYLGLHYFNGFTVFPIGVVPMICMALQFNEAQAITGRYKRKHSGRE